MPCVFNNWAVFYGGKFQTVNQLDGGMLDKIMARTYDGKIEKLWSKNATEGCATMKILERESAESDAVYRYMGQLLDKLGSDNSYLRTRALTRIAANAK